jgi:hypothetical protein
MLLNKDPVRIIQRNFARQRIVQDQAGSLKVPGDFRQYRSGLTPMISQSQARRAALNQDEMLSYFI